ncbi:MmgE/PrpD family protein [Ancylobacter sp. Lp-2]|uniref:MmgE/PrpD family protein n=1 Tax=Ancylobacter sp. Lp-2 TaxID=2881339 RepID=UPI001E5043B6|nr:MmgE/PrpD family protein [Ancylobacter sp. Lp-2]MCB4771574.1 MmgE/PrpD family protein [Ancylobacter sp. Lp-2]
MSATSAVQAAKPRGATESIIAALEAMTFESFPDDLVAAARTLIIDGIAVAVAGARLEEAPRLLAGHLRVQGGAGDVSALGLGFGLSAVSAAQLNGTSMHVLDYEPMWRPGTHALSPTLAASLALAEERGFGGRALITALVRGIEIQGWLREAGRTESHELRFHPPGMVGPIGSAVASATLLGFGPDEMANALGMASSRCGTLFTNLGTMTKSTHCGLAAASGLECALLTAAGFSADRMIFDAPTQGYIQAFMPRFDMAALMRIGEGYRILDPGFAIKIFPAKFSTHYGITAALELRPAIPATGDIARIEIVAANVPSSDRPVPETGLAGKFSVQYTVAAALLDGEVGLGSFTDERLRRADMQELLPKINLHMPKDMPSLYNTGRYAEVAVHMADGRVVSARCSNPRGSWGAEPISAAEHRTKVRACLATSLPGETVDEILDLAARVEGLDGAGLRRLLRLASGRDITN